MLEQHPNQGIRTNIGGTQRLAQLARDHHTERFVLISSDKAVNPQSVMGATKRVCELILHALSQQAGNRTLFTSVRFGNVLGSRGSVVPTFTRQIDSGGPVTVTHPEMTRYFMSIPEAANLVIHAACLTRGDDIFILRMGEVVRIVELAERMIRLRGLRPYVDIAIEFTGMRPGEKMHEELYDTNERPSDTVHPSIIELHSWSDDFDAVAFFGGLTSTLREHYDDSEEALRHLRDLMHISYNLTTAAD
jgi:FlaA1/EpsC-like NDP-sugar epimerase